MSHSDEELTDMILERVALMQKVKHSIKLMLHGRLNKEIIPAIVDAKSDEQVSLDTLLSAYLLCICFTLAVDAGQMLRHLCQGFARS